ncbi:MAG: DNA repair protein RadA [Acidimicrobiales bacterium]|nr:DNA repair protein RadA [Acidimicrobiales bacterium]
MQSTTRSPKKPAPKRPAQRKTTRPRTCFRCGECGATSPVWAGRCPDCGEWNTLVEEAVAPAVLAARPRTPARPIGEVADRPVAPTPTGVGELDRVLSGGLVPGSVTLLGGEPGIGKSTLLLQAAAGSARPGAPALYLSAEESAEQVRARADRLGDLPDDVWLAADTDLDAVVGHLDDVEPAFVVVDSIQTLHDPALSSAPGSVAQVRACAHRLVLEARARGTAVVLVGHVTKDGGLAGPRVLEHLVDTVLSFEGDRHHALRLLRAVKHRHGGTGELGVFEMTGTGLVDVDDPSALFLADRRTGTAGSVVVPVLDGGRPLLVEVQALLAPSNLPAPRRQTQGVDGGRLGMLLAVLEQRAGVCVSGLDVWVTLAGGVRTAEPAVDLGVALAVTSAVTGIGVPADLVVCGEIGLAGELRQVGHLERRMAEAARLGYGRVLVPERAPEPPASCRAVRASDLVEAIEAVGLSERPRARLAGAG